MVTGSRENLLYTGCADVELAVLRLLLTEEREERRLLGLLLVRDGKDGVGLSENAALAEVTDDAC